MNQIGCHKSVGGVVQNVQCWGPLPFIKSNECKRKFPIQVCVCVCGDNCSQGDRASCGGY